MFRGFRRVAVTSSRVAARSTLRWVVPGLAAASVLYVATTESNKPNEVSKVDKKIVVSEKDRDDLRKEKHDDKNKKTKKTNMKPKSMGILGNMEKNFLTKQSPWAPLLWVLELPQKTTLWIWWLTKQIWM
jgi:hypothetical protein